MRGPKATALGPALQPAPEAAIGVTSQDVTSGFPLIKWGARIAIAVAAVGMALWIYGCSKAGQETRSEFGSVSIPGKATVHLPADAVQISFQESDLGPGVQIPESAHAPKDLSYSIRPALGGAPLEITPRSGAATTVDRTGSEPIGQVKIAAAGDYLVASPTVIDRSEAVDPKLLLGESKSSFSDRRVQLGIALLLGGPLVGLLLVAIGIRRGARVNREQRWPVAR